LSNSRTIFVCLSLIFFSTDAWCTGSDSSFFFIPEVHVYQTRNSIFKDDKFIFRFDSITMLHCQNTNLGEFLQTNSPVIINQYGGSGSLTTLSLRGTGANHTQASWNGFPLNSLSSGDIDLSLLNTDMADQVQIIQTATGAIYGSGTFGGAIELNNIPDWNNRFAIKFNTEVGTFDQNNASNPFDSKPGKPDSRKFSLKMKIGNEWFQSGTFVIHNMALNRYPYIDYSRFGNPKNTQEHNQYSQTGLIQTLNFKLNNHHQVETGLWWQQKYYEIPVQLGMNLSNKELQRDSTLKTYLKWQYFNNRSTVVFKTAWFYDYLHYSAPSIDSRIGGKQWFSEMNYRNYFRENIIIDAGLSAVNLIASNNNYNKNVNENCYMVYTDICYKPKRYTLVFSIRKDFIPNYSPPLQLSLGGNYKVNNSIVVKANVSSKFRKPTFNEKYWPGLGNQDIKPETGWGFDAGSEINYSILDVSNRASLVLYSTTINDWIQWTPPYYKVQNYKQVWSYGIESFYEQIFKIRKTSFKWSVKYNYTPTVTTKYESNASLKLYRQLRLIPRHSASGNVAITFRSFEAGTGFVFHGRRYTSNDESYIPLSSYSMVHMYVGKTMSVGFNIIRVEMRINNLFDRQYELIPLYPMPGRSFYISVTYLFHSSKN
jgi:vitamin B12 transporter